MLTGTFKKKKKKHALNIVYIQPVDFYPDGNLKQKPESLNHEGFLLIDHRSFSF